MFPIFVALAGLVAGSFIGAFTYRHPKGIRISKGWSRCVKCKKRIVWYDNIPLISFILLKGRCRNCKKRISTRYPIIEAATSISFLSIWWANGLCSTSFTNSLFCLWKTSLGFYFWPFLFFLLFLLISIFVIDFEKRIIPDRLVFAGIIVTTFVFLLTGNELIYQNFLAGLLLALFFLLLNIITKGRGMGLGDAKLAVLGGLLLGLKYSFVWMFLSFLIGAIVGMVLILVKKAKFGQQIPFGPFLAFSLFIILVFGDILVKMLPLN